MMGRGFFFAAVMATCSSGCGGEVNLGGKSSDTWPGDGKTVEGPHAVETELVHQLFPPFLSSHTLAVAGDYVYFAGWENSVHPALHRCRKTSCRTTVEGLANTSDLIHSLQVYEQRLAVAAGRDTQWLGSYALPSASDKQVVVDNLPSLGGGLDPLFHGGFVYWSLPQDGAIYRCALPACAGGPERMGSWHNDAWLSGEGDLIFWLQGDGFIHRAAQFGGSPAQRLLADQTLSEAAAGDELDPSREKAGLIATSQGELYACLQSTGSRCGCNPTLSSGSDCVASVVRWPVAGGARETIVSLEERVSRFFVFEKNWRG
jgi:hypothetical protein